MTDPAQSRSPTLRTGLPGWGKVLVGLVCLVAVVVVVILDDWLTDNFTLDTRTRAETRLVLVGGNIDGRTRVLTTAIVLETRQGNFALALALGVDGWSDPS